jgi:hypothetical protein
LEGGSKINPIEIFSESRAMAIRILKNKDGSLFGLSKNFYYIFLNDKIE